MSDRWQKPKSILGSFLVAGLVLSVGCIKPYHHPWTAYDLSDEQEASILEAAKSVMSEDEDAYRYTYVEAFMHDERTKPYLRIDAGHPPDSEYCDLHRQGKSTPVFKKRGLAVLNAIRQNVDLSPFWVVKVFQQPDPDKFATRIAPRVIPRSELHKYHVFTLPRITSVEGESGYTIDPDLFSTLLGITYVEAGSGYTIYPDLFSVLLDVDKDMVTARWEDVRDLWFDDGLP